MENVEIRVMMSITFLGQQEYRFSIRNVTGANYLELNNGDISDISKVYDTADLPSNLSILQYVEKC